MDDFPASLDTAGNVAVDGASTGEIEQPGDRDWFSVSLFAGHAYAIRLIGWEEQGGTLPDPHLRLYDSEGILIAENDDFPVEDGFFPDSYLLITPVISDHYFISAAASGDSLTGTYTVSVRDGGFDLPDNPATPVSLELGVPYSSDFAATGDDDWLKSELLAGEQYRYLLEFGGQWEYFAGNIAVIAPDATRVHESNFHGSGPWADAFQSSVSGTHFLALSSTSGAASYDIKIELLGADISAGPDTEVALEPDVPFASDMYGNSDSDSFLITLEAGQGYGLSFRPEEGANFELVEVDLTAPSGERFAIGDFDSENLLTGALALHPLEFFSDASGQHILTLNNRLGTYTYDLELSPFIGADIPDTGHSSFYIVGTSGDDTITGSSLGDLLLGMGGDDLIAGGRGGDIAGGFAGNDVIYAGGGFDRVWGDAGEDLLSGGAGPDTVKGGPGDDLLFGGADDDILSGHLNNDSVQGNGGNDNLGGGPGKDTLHGGDGNDTIGGGKGTDDVRGGNGDDRVNGGGRDDVVKGGSGDDSVNGGDGSDTITGGAGADVFIWNVFKDGDADVVTDFEVEVDSFRMFGVQNAPGTGLQGKVDALGIVNVAGGAQIDYEGNTILVEGVTAAQLADVDNFAFL